MDKETAIAEGAAIQAHLEKYKEDFHFFEHKEKESKDSPKMIAPKDSPKMIAH